MMNMLRSPTAVPLVGITTIAPGESVVFFQLDETDPLDPAYDPIAETALFRSFWGGLAGVQVGYHAGAGLGKGDGITLFDAGDNQVLQLLYGMTSPNETHAGDWAAGNTDGSDTYENEAAVWVPGTDPQQFVLAAAGVYGSFANTVGRIWFAGIGLGAGTGDVGDLADRDVGRVLLPAARVS